MQSVMGRRAFTASAVTGLLLFVFVAIYVLQKPSSNTLRQTEARPFRRPRLPVETGSSGFSKETGRGNTAEVTDRRQRIRRPPDFIVIGARKCGTRALLSMINIHPHVVTAGPEVHYFDKDENYRQGLSWYINQMPKSQEGQLTGEKSPKYFVTPGVPIRIKNYSRTVQKDVKLLLVVKNPVKRVVSDYTQGLDKHQVSISKTKRIREEFNSKAFDQRTGNVNSGWGAISVSQYSTHLARWLKVFSFKQLHIVDGDKLVTDPAEEMKKVDK